MRDLGILISKDLKPSCQVSNETSKANRVLDMLKNTFTNRNAHILNTLDLLRQASPTVFHTSLVHRTKWYIKPITVVSTSGRRP